MNKSDKFVSSSNHQRDTYSIAVLAEWPKLLFRVNYERISWYNSLFIIMHNRNETISCWLCIEKSEN